MTEQEVTPEILGVLRSMDLLKGKDPDELTEWLGKAPFEGGAECALRQFPPGHRIIEEGSFGNSFFILTAGTVAVSLGPDEQRLATLGPGSFFGEMTLISGLPRNANVKTLEACQAVEVPRRAFEVWMKKPGPFRGTMDQTYIERGLVNHLRTIPDFAEIDPRVIQELVKKVRLRIFSKDETVVREGDDADSFYLIRDGYVRVVKKMTGGEQRIVAYLKDGAYFGETALLRSERRNATVIAMGKVEVIQVMKEDFFALMNRDDSFADRFAEEERRRLAVKPPSGKASSPLGFVGEAVERGLVKATSALVIHLNVCTRCGNCVKACAELHDGISRLTRHGMLFEAPVRTKLTVLEPLLVTTSCMHCLDPECMIGCPTGAITRDVNGEVIIQDSCIGCGNCARRCPYGNISMADSNHKELEKQRTGAPIIGGYLKFWKTAEDEPMMHEIESTNQKATVRRIAVKCDLCQDYNYNHGCVHNCPYGAIERIDAGAYLQEVRGAE